MSVRHRLSGLVMALMITQGIQVTHAQDGCVDQAGKFISVDNSVDVQTATSGYWKSNDTKIVLCQSETTCVGRRSHATISLVSDAVPQLDENTATTLRRKPKLTVAGTG